MEGSDAPYGSVQSFDAGSAGADGGARQALGDDGVVCLRRAFEAPWLSIVEDGIAAALAGASVDLDVVKREGDKGQFSFSSGAWQTVEPFRRFILDSPLADLVWPLLDSSTLALFYDFLLIKEAHSDSALTPWHQDHSYYPLDGTKVINSWVALDHIPLESALRFLSGSHSSSTLYRAVDFDDPSAPYRHARPELSLPSINPDACILATTLEPGDMLVWWSHTLHCAPGNRLDRRRAAFSVNWLGDDVTYNGQPALNTYIDPLLSPGDRVVGDKFPLVRQLDAVNG
ncbi:MAG TPA: phytanoyl-CoA dioxygenase family protein [Acidimicrobiales bacterium]|nr:short-chain dehydrogenase [Actinomycetota bacterium]MDP6062765.1 phytanoyl-CoA dioxygenase family protein [Acidimicrobiales bacterium]MDP6215103.1 phytanoyl-CoA dioxygenase family protein [Acidimicrobiales bacterium]MDP7208310.1 phytanoyl-CoA dioxygenase family protein [Acidimicrobiales bacterium]HJL90299.1 phytanoyl-CoA dioxygenase family protein [Acidimicrobiales bacterium]